MFDVLCVELEDISRFKGSVKDNPPLPLPRPIVLVVILCFQQPTYPLVNGPIACYYRHISDISHTHSLTHPILT